MRPIRLKLYYSSQTSTADNRNLEVDVTPRVAGSFQSFAVPLSSFSTTSLTGNPPNAPTWMSFAIGGDPANPASTWPCSSNDVVMLDNIAYAIAPQLSIVASNAGTVVLWPTNSVGFALQESQGAIGSGWTNVTASPFVVNGQNQLEVSPASDKHFYRLIGP